MAEQTPWATRTTTDHEKIREWVEARDAEPAHVKRTATDDDDLGVLRIDFPEEEADKNLEAVPWDAFFEKFESANLAFRYQNEKKNGEQSYFNRFVRRDSTGVAEVPDADVSVVAVGATSLTEEPEAESMRDEKASSLRNEEAASSSEPEMESASEMSQKAPSERDVESGAGMESESDDGAPSELQTGLTVGLVVDEIHEDARGYDHWNKNDEYLVFRNEGGEPLDLTGWTVENSDGHSYRFPDEYVLEPGEVVTLHSGSGDVTHRNLYWGSERAIWKNTGDVLTVRDDEGRRLIRESY